MRRFVLLLAFVFLLGCLSSAKKIEDCCCDAETVDVANDEELYNRLQALRNETYFAIFKVNLYSECPFWRNDGQCTSRGCSICGPCKEDELPAALRDESKESKSPVDRTLWGGFQGWQEDDEDVWIVQDNSPEMSYIDLRRNPEGYTGYGPPASTIIWKAIFDENCFRTNNMSEMCYEERVFFRLLSSIQAVTSAHIAARFPVKMDPHAENPLTAPNLDMFERMLGRFPERINNLYFSFVFLLRALNKARPLLYDRDYSIGEPEVDARVKRQMQELLDSKIVRDCVPSNSFDEGRLFSSPDTVPLKRQFKNHFRNISRILDCVSCEKCKMHSKLEVLGVGTALKILFAEKPLSDIELSRNEILALINMLGKLSSAIKIVHLFERLRLQRKLMLYGGILLSVCAVLLLAAALVRKCSRRKKKEKAQ